MKPISIETRFWSKCVPEPNSGCWLWLGNVWHVGYGTIWENGSQSYAHRVAWRLSRGPIPSGMQVLHKCDVRTCVNPDHLFLGTISLNMADKVAKGRQSRGETSGMSKLSEAQARLAIDLVRSGISQKDVAAGFGIDPSAISKIVSGKHWRHLQQERISDA